MIINRMKSTTSKAKEEPEPLLCSYPIKNTAFLDKSICSICLSICKELGECRDKLIRKNSPVYNVFFSAKEIAKKVLHVMINATKEVIVRPFKKNDFWRNFSGRS